MKYPSVASQLTALFGIPQAKAATVVFGPFLGEVGFETLYWIPQITTLATSGALDGHRVVVMSRGGTADLYRAIGIPFEYVDVLDVVSPEEYVARDTQRLIDGGLRAKNHKTGTSDWEWQLISSAGLAGSHVVSADLMHVAIRRFGSRALTFPRAAVVRVERTDNVILKFWFGAQMKATTENMRRVSEICKQARDAGPVLAIVNRHTLEDSRPFAKPSKNLGVDEPFSQICANLDLPTADTASERTNIADQIQLLASARAFKGTYGGFSYLCLYTRTPVMTYYRNPAIVFSRHFSVLAEALASANTKTVKRDPGLPFSIQSIA
ncbi:MAG: hypothetical protein Q7L55_10285 [Actinomycetota bacterium]|nr:hypothetical protein [Actinomycetota bacterium]